MIYDKCLSIVFYNVSILISLSLNLTIIPLTFNETTHSKYRSAHNADNIVILWMEGNFCDTASSFGARDNFSFLPEEINQLEVWRPALSQQVLGVVGEGERDDLVTGELRTSGQEGQLGHSINCKEKTFPVRKNGEMKNIRQ